MGSGDLGAGYVASELIKKEYDDRPSNCLVAPNRVSRLRELERDVDNSINLPLNPPGDSYAKTLEEGLHNTGHLYISRCSTQHQRPGPMYGSVASARDPIFYRKEIILT